MSSRENDKPKNNSKKLGDMTIVILIFAAVICFFMLSKGIGIDDVVFKSICRYIILACIVVSVIMGAVKFSKERKISKKDFLNFVLLALVIYAFTRL